MAFAEFSLPVRVYIEDTDAGGIVYYVNYLKFMERARTELMRAQGFGKEYIFNHDLMFVVRDVAVRYVKPAQLDDELLVRAKITELRGASMVFEQQVLRGTEVLAQGSVGIGCVSRSAVKPCRIPKEIIAKLSLAQAE